MSFTMMKYIEGATCLHGKMADSAAAAGFYNLYACMESWLIQPRPMDSNLLRTMKNSMRTATTTTAMAMAMLIRLKR